MSEPPAKKPLAERLADYGLILVAAVVAVWAVWFAAQRWRSGSAAATQSIRPLEWDELLRGGWIVGDASAAVTIVEFVSYPCPACSRLQYPLRTMLKAAPGDLRLILHHAPEPGDTLGEAAAVAAQCAGLQGRLWEFHDSTLMRPAVVSERSFAELASGVGVADSSAFRRCLSERATVDRVEDGRTLAAKLGVARLPALIVEGVWIRSNALEELPSLVGEALLRVRMAREERGESHPDDS